jgi:predicted GIY-YIG superfamily endonuclease
MFLTLTDDEVREVSGGLSQPRRQLAELRRKGFFDAKWGIDGKVKLTRDHYEEVCKTGGRINPNPSETTKPPKVPQPDRPTALYRHFSADGTLLYIGIAYSLLDRIAAHRGNATWFRQIATITVEHFPSREAAYEAETKAIKSEKPLHNRNKR